MGTCQSFREQLAIVILQKVPSQVQQPQRQFQDRLGVMPEGLACCWGGLRQPPVAARELAARHHAD